MRYLRITGQRFKQGDAENAGMENAGPNRMGGKSSIAVNGGSLLSRN